MAQPEIVFDLSTVGGRIQHLRHALQLSRSAFYDRVFPYGEAGSDSSKEATIRNWESGQTELDYQKLIDVCKILGCSADYLLGLDDCTNKSNQFIHDQTGLDEFTINRLIEFWDDERDKRRIDAFNFLFHSPEFRIRFLDAFSAFRDAAQNHYAYEELFGIAMDIHNHRIDYSELKEHRHNSKPPTYKPDQLEAAEFNLNRCFYRILDERKTLFQREYNYECKSIV